VENELMSEQPAILVRLQIPDEYRIGAVQLSIDQISQFLQERPAFLLNVYAQKIGVEIKEFPYSPKVGYFVDIQKRVATHRFLCKGIERRDLIFGEKYFQPLVHENYRFSFFNLQDAQRSYVIPITEIRKIKPVAISDFQLWESNGLVSDSDALHHPRPVIGREVEVIE